MLRLLWKNEINKRGIFGDQIGYGTWISASPPTHCFVHPSTVCRPDPCLEAGSGSQESGACSKILPTWWWLLKGSCFVRTNSLLALRWNSNGGYVASSLRQLFLILSVSSTTLYNKQNFVHQTTYWTLLPHADLSGDFRPGQCWGRVRWLWTPTTRPLARPSPPNTTRCCSWPHGASWTWLGRYMTRKPLLHCLQNY